MNRNYNLKLNLIAYILLLSIFSQSCTGASNRLVPKVITSANNSTQSDSQLKIIKHLVKKKVKGAGWELADFYQEDDGINVKVIEKHGTFTMSHNLSVNVSQDINLAAVFALEPKQKSRLVHLPNPQNPQPNCIYIFREGLLGGMMEGDEDSKGKEKEKEANEKGLVTPSSGVDISGRSNDNEFLPTIDEQEIQYVKQLGVGAAGIVYQAIYQGKTVAIKKLLHTTNEQEVASFKKEAIIMANHPHNNIVGFLGYCPTAKALMMEYVPGGSLASLLKGNADMSWQVRYQIALDVSKGLSYLHDCGIVHCDLKSQNILVDGNRRAKVADFGTAALKSENSTFGVWAGGTLRWMAPEIFHTNKNSQPADVYSYGMVLWQLGARKEPFETVNGFQLFDHLKAGINEVISEDTPIELRRIIELCWLPEPPLKKTTDAESRPNMRQLRHQLKESAAIFLGKAYAKQPKPLQEKLVPIEDQSFLLNHTAISGEVELTTRAVQGAGINDIEAEQLAVAKMYLSPNSSPEVFAKGFSILESLGQAGYADAQYILGCFYDRPETDMYKYLINSDRISPNNNEAERLHQAKYWYKLAAEQKNKNAARTLGRLYKDRKILVPIPIGEPQDGRHYIRKALKYYRKAQEAGSTTVDTQIVALEKQLQDIVNPK